MGNSPRRSCQNCGPYNLEIPAMLHSNDSSNSAVIKLLTAGVLVLLSSCTQNGATPSVNTATHAGSLQSDELPEVVITASRKANRLASPIGSR